ncbi:MAG: hypothetical protein IPK07_16775 [Deltaproteobacteria bacterium]|nr:hypothetical protein [Deltaproteobacteria bacterium]
MFDSNFSTTRTFADLATPVPANTLIVNATSLFARQQVPSHALGRACFNDSQLARGLREMRLIRGNYTERHVPFRATGLRHARE